MDQPGGVWWPFGTRKAAVGPHGRFVYQHRKPETRDPPTHFGAAGKKMARGWISNAVAAVKFGHLQLITPYM